MSINGSGGWRRVARLAEMALLYGGAPLLFVFGIVPTARLFPLLIPAAVAALLCMHRSQAGFSAWRGSGVRESIPAWRRSLPIGLAGVAAALALLLVSRGEWGVAVPSQVGWFGLPQERPGLYALLMVGYPLFSVYPQEVVFRAWFYHRYAPALGSERLALAVNALCFGWAHVIFKNPVAVLLCVLGGALFARTYRRTGSLAAASLEHAVYGCWIFTVGLGWYFFGGSMQALARVLALFSR